ncbi:sulfurtransferase [Aestuariibaculum suncheonense]|uniref:Sulfurtransferase n=1 Tax=Aestuariibaculum suncheonense TaxID=1028745 RepID=A0A8J6Q7E2_9FLAO|nr:sulfurtransferase [Aestuariibaculum suncheonense]MBD0835346.1 sulfurtransferase [Aestuariibaculum suncheonense]
MAKLVLKESAVTVDWLYKRLDAENLVILDGTINKTFDAFQEQIPNTRFFDIKNKFSEVGATFPSTFPSAEQFEREAQALGINNNSAIVVYDDKGIYSSARVWWLFKAFGHDNVAVLSGGFPSWNKVNYPTEAMTPYSGQAGDFIAELHPESMKFFEDMKNASANKTHTIIDARSQERFNCEEPEPREGLRMGTIPNSVNLPFTDLLQDGELKPTTEIEAMFSNLAEKNEPIIFSCGSGITACVLALGAELSGYKNISVYDGSWTEWGSLTKS